MFNLPKKKEIKVSGRTTEVIRVRNSTLELLDMKTLRKQLIEEEFIISNSEVKKIKDGFTGEAKTYKIAKFKIIK